MKVNTGITESDGKRIAEGLGRVLADSYTLYLKTHNYHWNVTGPTFPQLHTLFETQYTGLATAVDDIAERIRALGHPAPGSYKQFAALSEIKEADGAVPSADKMVTTLAKDNETVVSTCRSVLPVAQEANDEATVDLLVERMREHEKTAWMLRATAG
ncbi:MAG: Dps family protein [Kiloniellales bacterium]